VNAVHPERPFPEIRPDLPDSGSVYPFRMAFRH